MTRTHSAVVVGGGIGGPVAAMALGEAGIEATVYEAYARPADGAGAFLTVASNGIGALRTIGADGRVLEAGFPTPAIALRSTTGKDLGAVPMGTPLLDGTTSHTLTRADLHRAIHDEAVSRGITVARGKRLVGVDEDRNGVTARFEDGSEARADVLIGADGIHSTVRILIDRKAPRPAYAGLIGLGGYARGVDIDTDPGTYTMIFGKRAFFGYVVAPSGDVWWFANVPKRDEPARGALAPIGTERWKQTLVELLRHDAGPAVRLVHGTNPTDMTGATVFHTIPHLPVWATTRMVAIGDAAHAPTPSSGQGASLAIEDAVVVAMYLRDIPDPRQAFAAFESARRPRVERIIKAAARTNSNKTAGPIGRTLRDAMFPIALRLMANSKRLQEPYDYAIDWNSPAVGEPLERV